MKGNPVFTVFPFRFSWIQVAPNTCSYIQVLLTVSKRNFSKANQRNRIKRQLRELYRLNKPVLYEDITKKDAQYALMISYIAKVKMPSQELSKTFHQSILRLKSELKKNIPDSVHPADKSL